MMSFAEAFRPIMYHYHVVWLRFPALAVGPFPIYSVVQYKVAIAVFAA